MPHSAAIASATEARPQRVVDSPDDARPGYSYTARMRILLIEDHQDIADNVCEYLNEKGHKVEHALTGEEGLKRAANRSHDVIVLDIMLPGMDGLAVCRALRGEHRVQAPVLMLTAKDLVVDKVAGFEAGADDYL